MAGDLDGDGYADLVASAPGDGWTGGAVYVWAGGSSGPEAGSETALESALGSDGNGFGVVVSTGGDLDGDGMADLVVGANSTDDNTGAAPCLLWQQRAASTC